MSVHNNNEGTVKKEKHVVPGGRASKKKMNGPLYGEHEHNFFLNHITSLEISYYSILLLPLVTK
jgi:hypothetical protein